MGWKASHEVICALDKTTTCTVPTCPTVTPPTLADGVANADSQHCTPEPTKAPTRSPTKTPTRTPTRYPTKYPTRHPWAGRCCALLSSCNNCPRGDHHVWPHECTWSRKCNN